PDPGKEVDDNQKGKEDVECAEGKRSQTKDADRKRDGALQLHVQWLAIVLMYTNARTDAARTEAIGYAVAFVDTVVETAKKGDGELGRAAHEDVLGSVIAKFLKLETSVTRIDHTAFVPGDVDGIYDQ